MADWDEGDSTSTTQGFGRGSGGGSFGSKTNGETNGWDKSSGNSKPRGFGRGGGFGDISSSSAPGGGGGGGGFGGGFAGGDDADDGGGRGGGFGGGKGRNSDGGGGGNCYKCNESGHFARDCPNSEGSTRDNSCRKCHKEGHFARDCPDADSSGGGNCYKCNESGHFARDCPNSDSTRDTKCHKCGEEGHFARDCTNAAAEGDTGKPAPVTYVPPTPSESEDDIFLSIQQGINFAKFDDIPVEVTGSDPVKPIQSFDQAQLTEQCLLNVKKAKYSKPTPVQKYAIPTIMAGRDVMACAQTGSGKTAAFLLPVMTGMLKSGLTSSQLSGECQSPQAVCVAPTRELANQIFKESRKFSLGTMLRPVVCYGGVSVGHQLRQIECGCNLLVATPGRLMDFVERGRISFKSVKYLILDEADRMLDMGFEPTIRKIVETMGMPEKTERQTLMFSATFPEEIQRLAGDFLSDYIFLTVGRVGGTTSDIEQNVVEVSEFEKRGKLTDILSNAGTDRTLVFVESKRGADFLAVLLSGEGFPTTSIHGDRMQQQREEALEDFRKGRCPVLIATNVAARGLDINDVKHVINYDLPSEIDEYVHRIGRTGRIGHQGKATSFFQRGKDDKIARGLVKILSDASQEVPEWLEEIAESAVGTGYGPAGGRFASRDTRKQYGGGGGGGRHGEDSGGGWDNVGEWNSSDANNQVNGTSAWTSGGGGGGGGDELWD